jgi:hypothetical protein
MDPGVEDETGYERATAARRMPVTASMSSVTADLSLNSIDFLISIDRQGISIFGLLMHDAFIRLASGT